MEVKGAAFVARKDALIKQFGDNAWNSFINDLGEQDKYFQSLILSTTPIPAEKFLKFQDLVVKIFYNNDQKAHWINGEASAEYSLIYGPYRMYLSSNDVLVFAEEKLPTIWKMYYSEGDMSTKVTGNLIDIIVKNIPIQHVYFEYTTMAYCKRAIELVGTKILEIKKIKGPSIGTNDIHYQFIIE